VALALHEPSLVFRRTIKNHFYMRFPIAVGQGIALGLQRVSMLPLLVGQVLQPPMLVHIWVPRPAIKKLPCVLPIGGAAKTGC